MGFIVAAVAYVSVNAVPVSLAWESGISNLCGIVFILNVLYFVAAHTKNIKIIIIVVVAVFIIIIIVVVVVIVVIVRL